MYDLPIDQPQGMAMPKSNKDNYYPTRPVFFSPIRYCGKLWNWIKEPNDRVSLLALKILAVPFVGCFTIVSGLLAGIGALIFSNDIPKGCSELISDEDIAPLRRNITEEQIAEKIQEDLGQLDIQYSVQVRSRNRYIYNNYAENIDRYITLKNSSSSAISRYWETIKYHFFNKNISNIYALYHSVFREKTAEGLDQLIWSLKTHGSVTFFLPFDLAYVYTELGPSDSRCPPKDGSGRRILSLQV